MSFYEETLMEFKRKGDIEKVKWLESLDKRITVSQKKRIQENDKRIMQELFAPKWASWELLYSWATKDSKEKSCSLCDKKDSVGMDFKGKFVCANCFIELKQAK
jgi:hypothetical protein